MFQLHFSPKFTPLRPKAEEYMHVKMQCGMPESLFCALCKRKL